MSDKIYPLEIESVGGDTYIVMTKGHHDPNLFMKQVREEGYNWPLGHPEHRYVKATPCETGEYVSKYHFVEKGTSGAFPATYAWEASGDQLYQPPS